MNSTELVLLIGACVSSGFILGYFFRIIAALARKNSIELDIKKITIQSEQKAKNIVLQAEEKAGDLIESARQTLSLKEQSLIQQQEIIALKEKDIQKKDQELKEQIDYARSKVEEIKEIKNQTDSTFLLAQKKLEETAILSKENAKELLLKTIDDQEQELLAIRTKKLELYSEGIIEDKAKEILTLSIQRLATKVSSEILTSHIVISDPEIKGKIIGKEGRNIRVLERETGVEILVDESPDSITISSFDPIRRFIARESLEELISDGRIQPAKIEKIVADTKEKVQRLIRQQGEKALRKVDIPLLDPHIIQLLGRLHFRTSFGQNVLEHSIEVAHLAGMLAAEIGANVRVSKTAGLLHDIGKALDHEVQGTHVEIGKQVLERFGVEDSVIKSMQAHHEEYPYETLESRIVQAADAISGGRPGARNNSLEFYIKRLADLEQIALTNHGVEKAYAIQAGREIRVFVNANTVSDHDARNMAKNIAQKIENELKYPGEIKVTVIREMRAIEVAL